MHGHFTSKTVSSSTMSAGDAPRIPEESNQIPVSFTVFPVLRVNALMASPSLSTPRRIALTLDKSYSASRRFSSEGGDSSFRMKDRAKVTGGKSTPSCDMPSRVVSLANCHLTNPYDFFLI